MIDQVWSELRADESHRTGVVRRRIAKTAKIDLYAAVEHPQGTPLLFAEIAVGAVSSGFQPPDATGFSVRFAPASEGNVQIEFRLLDIDGEQIFRSFVDAVIEAVSGAPDQRSAFEALTLQTETWQEFFRRHGISGLSVSAQQGLFGELWVLRELLSDVMSPALAVEMWVGPTGTNQDFELDGYALEVKTSTANPLRSVRASNLLQLDSGCLRALRLILVEAERHANGVESLPWAVAAARSLVRERAPHQLLRLNRLLVLAGYLDCDAPRYSAVAYPVRAVRSFAVSDPFPRLTEGTVPQGVGDVRYSIALEALTPHEMAIDDLRAELSGLDGDHQ